MKAYLSAVIILLLLAGNSNATDAMTSSKLSRPDLATSFVVFFDDLLAKADEKKGIELYRKAHSVSEISEAEKQSIVFFKSVYPDSNDIQSNIDWLAYANQHKQPVPFPRMYCIQEIQSCIVKLAAGDSWLYQKFQLREGKWVMVDLSDEEYKKADSSIK